MALKSTKTISRNPDHYMRETKFDLFKVQRNFDPDLHPFAQAREYKEALNAVKLERVFAKPFVGNLSHSESVTSMCCHPKKLSCVYTGTAEGELYFWNLQTKQSSWKVQAHDGQIHCISAVPEGHSFFSVGNDKTVKQWKSNVEDDDNGLPVGTWLNDTIITGITHHRGSNEFITCGQRVLLWDINSKAPKSAFDWRTSGDYNEGSIVCVKLNQVEKNVFVSSDHANNIMLYDIRAKAVKKVKMNHRINALEWNPMEPFIFTAASEDYNCYSFDIRKMGEQDSIIGVHIGHTSAVIDLHFSPTGKEFCSGSYDKSIRIFPVDRNNSRDVYHSKRMYKIGCVLWSADNKYILSGSSDHNVRLWKGNSNEKMGIMRQRERASINYANELKRKYQAFPEIKKIARHRHLPKHLFAARKELDSIHKSVKRKHTNRKLHSKPGSVPDVSARQAALSTIQDDPEPAPMSASEDSDSDDS